MLALLGFSLLALFSTLIPTAAAASCNCYETDSEDFFTDYQFFDFRTITPVAATPPLPSVLPTELDPKNSDYTREPGIGTQQTGWMRSDDWSDYWATMDWGKVASKGFPTRMQNSLANVYISGSDVDTSVNATSKLVFRTHRFPTFQSSGEVESQIKNLFYASIRIRARVTGASGAVAGLFIYQNGQNESDIEILTRDKSNEIRYSNQPVVDESGNEIVGASTSVDMATGAKLDGTYDPDDKRRLMSRASDYGDVKWNDWNTHRIDWVEGKSSWFINGQHYLDKTYGVPNVPSYFVMNMWSDGGVWSGNMTVGQSAYMEIEWIEMVYNTSGTYGRNSNDKVRRADSSTCGTVCIVDGVQVMGEPEEGVAAAASIMVQYSMLFGGVILAVVGMGVL